MMPVNFQFLLSGVYFKVNLVGSGEVSYLPSSTNSLKPLLSSTFGFDENSASFERIALKLFLPSMKTLKVSSNFAG